MPLVVMQCENGHRWQDIVGGATLAGAAKDPVCNQCGASGTRLVAGGHIQAKGYDYDNIDPLEHQAMMEHRQHLEENHHKRESGEWTVIENGPDRYRPFGNAPRPRKFF